MTVPDRLRAAFARDDFEEMIAVLDRDVVWLGYAARGEEAPMCRGRDEVRAWFEWHIAQGHRALPKIVGEGAETIVVEMNVQDAPDEDLHQVLTVRDDRVIHIRDCRDRASALEEASLQ